MTLSYKWLSEYLPVVIEPDKLAEILTAVGLEVEARENFETYKGGLEGLVVGEVLTCDKHPNADKLKLTTVNIGNGNVLKIVCGAPNVAAGQKVIVAPVGATIYPAGREPVTMKLAKIRGYESQGMICAEDEIGLGTSHEGILILPADVAPGTAAGEYFNAYNDIIFEIGLTPNRMDAMSHLGVAKDVCAYLTHHENKMLSAVMPADKGFQEMAGTYPIQVRVENTAACPRYSGISISGIQVTTSPLWLQQKLKAIGLRPINNVVDITNFILHETGQPLHAFDADKIKGNTVIVKNLPEGTPFITLDEKERKLAADDLMICDAEGGICLAGVFGGLHSGVTDGTTNIFLESACFDKIAVRKTSFRHGLRTDAALRFEKGTDISATVTVLKRAATLITAVCGGIASGIADIYPAPKQKHTIQFKYDYLQKLSGKKYEAATVQHILSALGFEITTATQEGITVAVPYSKPDVQLPADIVEEILRIDGLDNVEIPASIRITPAIAEHAQAAILKEKTADYLAGSGYHEILTNSITNKEYFSEAELNGAVRMKNSLSAALNIMRPSMLETGLEVVAHNLNHKNESLHLFEFGKTYQLLAGGSFAEPEHLCLYITGNETETSWQHKSVPADFFSLKSMAEKIFRLAGITDFVYTGQVPAQLSQGLQLMLSGRAAGFIGIVARDVLQRFSIRQPVFFADIYWDALLDVAIKTQPVYTPIARYPAVQRDVAVVVDSTLKYAQVKDVITALHLPALRNIQLFDIFESEKLGAGKKSIAISFTFQDDTKTLTDEETDLMMKKITGALEKTLHATIRK